MRKKDEVLAIMAKVPMLLDSLIEGWDVAACCVGLIADEILHNDGGIQITMRGETLIDEVESNYLTGKGVEYLLLPFTAEHLARHCALMDRLDADGEKRFCDIAQELDNSWNKLFAAIPCRFPALADDCAKANEHRRELMHEVADLYLGEIEPILTVKWARLKKTFENDLASLQKRMNAAMKGGAK